MQGSKQGLDPSVLVLMGAISSQRTGTLGGPFHIDRNTAYIPRGHNPSGRYEGATVNNQLDRSERAKPHSAERSRGQILILFVMALFVFTGMVALVIDVSWYWVSSLRIQRAADAAALAGAVQLPMNPSGAYVLAFAEAEKNGYAVSDPSVTITPVQEPALTGRRLAVTITAPVNTFFMGLLGIHEIMSTKIAKAEFVLPVPMGSPENYYGVFGEVRGLTTTGTVDVTTNLNGDSGLNSPDATLGVVGTAWTSTSGSLVAAVADDDGAFAQADANGDTQQWSDFDLLAGLDFATDEAKAVNGIVVELTDAHVQAACPGAFIEVALSYDGGTHWTTDTANNRAPATGDLTTSGADIPLGLTSSTSAWQFSPPHSWDGNDLGTSRFRLRLTANESCGAATQIRVDRIRVRALYDVERTVPTVTTTTLPDADLMGPSLPCANGVAGCYQAAGEVLNPRGFWGTMNTQGAENVNGDAYQPYYDNNTSDTNVSYNPDDYYNYAVEIPPLATNGSVYVFDPVFCATSANKGTGDRWFSSDSDPVSSFFELYDSQGTLYDRGDDGAPIASSAGLFRNVKASDTTMGGATGGSPAECRNNTDATYGDGRDFHNQWYRLATGLSGGANGKVYRLHTTSTDPLNASAQLGTDGENSFALYVDTPGARIYGIGAMQAFTPLSANGSTVQSEFYLAQIEAVHAGKMVEIKLWDPGDTNPLSASLQILVPNSSGWSPALMDYSAAKGTTNSSAANCASQVGDDAPSVQTNVGATSGTFNGCWLTITIPIGAGYTAEQDGWWKIRYTMNGTGTSNDVTTWKVAIRGNPVHLIIP